MTDVTPAATPAKAKRTRPERLDHSAAIAAYAKMKGVDTTKGGKLFRARLRANFDTIAKRDAANYGAKGKFKQHKNDNKPWGTHSRAVLKDLGLTK